MGIMLLRRLINYHLGANQSYDLCKSLFVGKPVVTAKYIDDSAKADRFLDEWQYILPYAMSCINYVLKLRDKYGHT